MIRAATDDRISFGEYLYMPRDLHESLLSQGDGLDL